MKSIIGFALLSMMIIGSCGKSNKNGAGTDESKPVYGGTLIYGKSGPPITLDPASSRETESSVVVANIFEGLVEQRAGRSGVDPCLARSWDISADALDYVFHLRSGSVFHDGTPVNADAVLFSIESQYKKDHPFYSAEREYNWNSNNMNDIVKTVTAVNDTTVRFTLKKPNATFLSLLSLNFMSLISPAAMKKHGKAFYKNPVGAGAFRFVSWKEDGTVILTANETYWNGRPYLDTLILKPISDPHQRWMALKEGRISMMGVPDKQDMDEISQTAGIKYSQQPGLNISYLGMNTIKKPFNDIRVRKAVVYAINREKIVNEVYGQFGRAAKNPIPPVLTGYNDEIRFTPYDPDESRKLLAEAGLAGGFKTKLWTMPISREYMPEPDKAAKLIQQDLKQVGIEAEIVTYPWKEYLERVYRGEHDLAIVGWIADLPDPDNFFYILLDKTVASKTPSTNVAFYQSDEMHHLILTGKTVSDPLERSSIYKKACELFNKDLPWFTIAHSVTIVPMRDHVMNFQLHTTAIRKFKTTWIMKKELGAN